jgi:N-acetylneuraminic acid mutarotase
VVRSSTRTRMAKASARVAGLACALLLVFGAVPGAMAAPAPGTPPSAAQLDSAAAFRQKLGFRADRAYVAASFARQGFTKARWGVPLDAAEAAEVGRRARLQQDAGRALNEWAEQPGTAGAYFDHGAKGAPVFLTTRDPATAKGALARSMPDGANARFVRVAHSMADLLATQDRVNADMDTGALAGLGVTSTAIDARANTVVVGVAADTDAVRDALAARYGDAVTATFELPAQGGDACSSRDDCSPAKAGIEIVSSYNGNNCTMGFLARVVGSGEARVLTAGHCIGKSGGTGTSRKWSHDGITTWAEFSTWADGADADVGVLTADGSAISGSRNLLYRASASDVVPVSGLATNAQQVQGGLICRAAAVSGHKCGTIELTNRTKDVDGRTIDHQWVVDFDACPGDSGAPYYLNNTAYGSHSDSSFGCEPSTNQAWYSPIQWMLDVLEAKGHPMALCVTAACGSDTNVWTQRGPLDGAVWNPILVPLADGRVLRAGGNASPLLGAGSATGQGPETFDPATGQWTDTATPPWGAQCDGQFAVRLASGDVLVGGGRKVGSGSTDACDGAHVYDPDDGPTGSWSTVASPPTRLEAAGAVLLDDGRAFVTGGSGANGATSVAMAYDPGDDAWETLAPAASGALAPLVLPLPDGRVLVSGGYVIVDDAPGYDDVTATRLYDPDSNTWDSTTSVGSRGAAGVVLASGRVVIAGGQHLSWDGSQHATFLSTVRRFDPSTDGWTTLDPLRTARAGFALAELEGGWLLAMGGSTSGGGAGGTASATGDAWDPASQNWVAARSLQAAHAEAGSAVLDDGRMLVAGGGTATTETYVRGDLLPPTGGAPSVALRSSATMSTPKVPIRLSWSTATDTGGAGTGTYEVARSTDGGAFTTIATRVTGTTYDTTVTGNHRYRFQVRPRDWAGNFGSWKPGTEVRIGVTQQTSGAITWSSGWTTASNSSYTGGTLKYHKTSGKAATYTFTGRAVAWVSTRGPARGSAKVYIDGSLVATVNLNHSSTSYRYVAYQRSWSSSGKHTIRIVVNGTSGHPRVDVDAFEVITNP